MKLILTGVLTALVFATTFAQESELPEPKPVYDSQDRVLLGIYNLSNDCGAELSFTGTVVRVRGEWPNFDVVLKTPKGVKQIGVNVSNVSMADNGNLHYYLLKRGKRLRVDAFLCGSGGFLWANNIKLMAAR